MPVLCLMLCLAPVLLGQGQFGSILGSVTDPSGGVIPGAKITATNVDTSLQVGAVSNQFGVYQLLQLTPGTYSVEAEAAGFKKAQRASIRVQVADRVTLDLALEVGLLTETVQVTSEAPPLRTFDAQTGEVVNNTMIQNLPQLQRDPLRLLVLSGNVQGSGDRASPGSDTRINGGRTIGVQYRVDGITSETGLGHKVVDVTPTMESVAEFKVITNGVSAEYGRLSGGTVEVVTKGGTNEFHGQLFEYFQNDHLNANSWSQNSLGGKKVKFAQNIFGGMVGGPVVIPKVYNGRAKTFFLFNYEGMRLRQAGSLQQTSVPSALERTGDFTQSVYYGLSPVFYDQNGPVVFSTTENAWVRQQMIADGKHIPPSMINPVSKELLKWVQAPNQAPTPGTSSINNYIAPRSSTGNRDIYGARIDQSFTENHRLFGRMLTRDYAGGNTRWRGPASVASQNLSKGGRSAVVNYDWTISPSLLFNTRAGINHWPTTSGNLLPADLNTSSVPWDAATREVMGSNNLPYVQVSGGYAISDNGALNIKNYTTFDTGATVTKIFGRHTVKTGFQHTRYFDNFSASPSGRYSFHAGPVDRIAGVDFGYGSNISNAEALGSFLVGTSNEAWVLGGTTRANNFNYYAGFVQDDFKVNSKLTLNLGLRWDMESPITERHNKLYLWDPQAPAPFKLNAGYNFANEVGAKSLTGQVRTPSWVGSGFPTGAIRIAGTPEFPGRKGTYYHTKQFSPRIGAAYQLDRKTVVRGSFALMYIPISGAELSFSGSGLKLADGADAGWHASDDNLIHVISNFANPYKPGQFTRYSRTNASANFDATGPSNPGGSSRDSTMAKELTFSFGFQRELARNLVVEAVYNGNLGRDLVGAEYLGTLPKDLFSGGPLGNNRRIYTTQIASPTAGQTQSNAVVGPLQNLALLQADRPYFGAFTIKGVNLGRSNFHGLNLRLERRFSDLTVLFNYTFSKLLDDVGGTNYGSDGALALGYGGTELGTKRNQTVDKVTDVYGVSPLDETHVIRFAFNYELPVGRSKALLGSPQSIGAKILDGAVGGWELAGMGNFRSGRPVRLNPSNANINNNIRMEVTYGSFIDPANPTASNPAFAGDMSKVFYSSRDPIPTSPLRRFFNAKDADQFVYGTLPPIFPRLRQPSGYAYDMSLMKAFYLGGEGKRYVQVRMEGTNILNIRGFGSYGTTINTTYYGMITSAGMSPRNIQISARLVF